MCTYQIRIHTHTTHNQINATLFTTNTTSSRQTHYEYAPFNYLKEETKDFVFPFISLTHSACGTHVPVA